MAEVLRCDLRRFDLSLVLQMVHSERLSGRLSVASDAAILGSLAFTDGELVEADSGSSRGIPAALELFVLATTKATFFVGEHGPAPALGNITALVLEGCRLRDTWGFIAPRVLVVAPNRELDGSVASNPELSTVIETLDGRRSILELVERTGVRRVTVVDGLRALVDRHILVESSTPMPPTVEPTFESDDDELPFYDALESARRAYSSGLLAEAAAGFRRALGLRPDDRFALQNIDRLMDLHPELRTLT